MTVSPRRVDGPHGLNELAIAGIRYLLVGVSSSHLAGLAEGDEPRRGALAEWRTGTEPWAASYDLDALVAAIWNPRTLCGLGWIEMEPAGRATVRPWRYERSRTELSELSSHRLPPSGERYS